MLWGLIFTVTITITAILLQQRLRGAGCILPLRAVTAPTFLKGTPVSLSPPLSPQP